MTENTGREWLLTGVTVTQEESDLLVVRSTSTVPTEAETIRQLEKILNEVTGSRTDVYLLTQLSNGKGMEPEARKEASKLKGTKLRAMVFFGGSPVSRALLQVLFRGMALVGQSNAENVVFLKEEGEARAWIHADRLKRVAKASAV